MLYFISYIASIYSFYVFSILHFYTGQAIVKLPHNVTIPAFFAFGDSVLDTGNNNNLKTLAKCNFPPYGRDFMGGKPTGRFGNGKVPPDFIVEQLGIKELLPPYLDPNLTTEDLLTGVNFASGGAGYDPLTSQLLLAVPLTEQIELFNEYIEKVKEVVGEERANTIITKSIYMISASSNDIANNYFHTPTRILEYNVSAYLDFLATSASLFLQDLYQLGARRIGVFSAPPLGCLPMQRTLGGGKDRMCVESYNEAAQLFNSKLSELLNDLNSKLHRARMVHIDCYNSLNELIQNPTNYGFEVANNGCCGTGTFEVSFLCNSWSAFTCTNDSKYVFWDSYHPSEKAYRVMINQLLQNIINQFFS